MPGEVHPGCVCSLGCRPEDQIHAEPTRGLPLAAALSASRGNPGIPEGLLAYSFEFSGTKVFTMRGGRPASIRETSFELLRGPRHGIEGNECLLVPGGGRS